MSTAYLTPDEIVRIGAQERFTMNWLDNAQEWVVYDANGAFVFRGSEARTSDFLVGFKLGRYSKKA